MPSVLQIHSTSKTYYGMLKVRKIMQKVCYKQQDRRGTLSEMTVYPIRRVINSLSMSSFLVYIAQCLQNKFYLFDT